MTLEEMQNMEPNALLDKINTMEGVQAELSVKLQEKEKIITDAEAEKDSLNKELEGYKVSNAKLNDELKETKSLNFTLMRHQDTPPAPTTEELLYNMCVGGGKK